MVNYSHYNTILYVIQKKMRLLFVIETIRARGAERITAILTEQLAELFHDVYLICTGFVRGDEYPVSPKVHLEFIPEKEGSRARLFLFRIRYIREKIAEIRPDCIISLAGARTLFMTTVAHAGFSIPMIFSERHDPVHNPKSKAERLMRLICYRKCDRVVFQTDGARTYFSKPIAEKGIIIPNPILQDLPVACRNMDDPYIATFCKLIPQKNISLLLRAFAILSPEYPNVQLVIYGDGDLKEELEQEAKELDISEMTVFKPHSLEVHQLIRDCTMIVSSSDYEGQSNTMLEAMAMGLPCVCTDCPCGGARAVITDKENGLLVPVCDKKRLASAMEYLLTHPEEALRMGQKAAEIKKEREPRKIAAEWEKLINSVVKIH